MTDEQKAAYVFAQAVAAMAEIAGMQAENQTRLLAGEAPAYGEKAFQAVGDNYTIHHNSTLTVFHSW